MNRFLKVTGGALLVLAGLGAIGGGSYWVLTKRQVAETIEEQALPAEGARDTGPQIISALEVTPLNWVFKLKASAVDGPESPRQFEAQIEFIGSVASCKGAQPQTIGALGLDKSGGVATASREALFCVASCGEVPPAPVSTRLGSSLLLSAFSEEFGKAPEDYAPQGLLTAVQWQCGGRSTRLVAASLVALACNSENCDDEQIVNAAVYLGIDSGAQLDSLRALFPLKNTTGKRLVGVSSPP